MVIESGRSDRSHGVAGGHAAWLEGGGEAGSLIRSIDWAATPLGPIEDWSPALCSTVALLLHNQSSLVLWWGPEYVQLYNDAYRQVIAEKHPRAMGQPARECWTEIWDIIGPMIDRPFHGGSASTDNDLRVLINRRGFAEETHWRLAYSPVPDLTVTPTKVGGVLGTVTEITEQVFGERQLRTLRELGARSGAPKTAELACQVAATTLAMNPSDVPFALFYLLDQDGSHARLVASAGFPSGQPDPRIPVEIHVASDGADTTKDAWHLREAVNQRRVVIVDDLTPLAGVLPASPQLQAPHTAIVLPLTSPDHPHAYGALVCGASAHRVLDDDYQAFFELVAAQVMTTIRNALAFDAERRRAEELESIDRAKTAFLSNVSHELRTPLTLIMGPTDDALASPEGALKGEALRLVQRNEVRLLKLVNSLLDFARMEAGRAQATFQPTDLGRFTRDVASAFSSALASAGIELVIDCVSQGTWAFIDRTMWEKVVLNLLSNALKFTFAGRVVVRCRVHEGHAELEVSDTGVGIPAHELPHLFERFHRVPGARSRTHEGSGIGLALVSEIVKMHGGTVDVRSVVDQGTTFSVRIPLGSAHLDPRHVDGTPGEAAVTRAAAAFVSEAMRWLPGTIETTIDEPAPIVPLPAEVTDARIIVADDNADMREYLTRLLSKYWRVEAVADGAAAVAAARREQPDLVLSDVMMPVLDGFGVVRELHADASLTHTPILLLSARAGEEASVEGLQAGADDYLVKPFSSRELVARVATHLELHRSRERLDLAIKGGALGAWDWNVKTGEFIYNERWAEIRGYEPGEPHPQARSLFDNAHPDDVPRMKQALEAHFEGRLPEYSVELRIVTRDGRWVWIHQRGKVFARDENGRPVRMAGTSLDITVQKRSAQAQRFLSDVGPRLQESLDVDETITALADLVVKHLADYCVVDIIEDDGAIRRAKVVGSIESKQDLAQVFGRLQLGGQRTPILMQVPEGAEKLLFETVVSADLEAWARNEEHLRLLRQSEVSSLLWVPLIGRDRVLGGFCLASTALSRHFDHDDLWLAEELARRASLSLENARLYRTAERAIEARDEVLAVVAHDLRNPLGAIMVQASMLGDRQREPESAASKASERIERAVDRMDRLIGDLLDISRAEAGKLALDCAPLRTRDVAAEAVEAQKAVAAAASIEVRLDASEPLPDIYADHHRVLQVFENLIGNALRFTPPGGRITVGVVPQGELVLCRVQDTGSGISPEALPHIFDRFWQARRSRTVTRSGAGLGLAIVKSIVEAHGGRIWVESEPGSGSAFFFTIPTVLAPRRKAA